MCLLWTEIYDGFMRILVTLEFTHTNTQKGVFCIQPIYMVWILIDLPLPKTSQFNWNKITLLSILQWPFKKLTQNVCYLFLYILKTSIKKHFYSISYSLKKFRHILFLVRWKHVPNKNNIKRTLSRKQHKICILANINDENWIPL